MLTSTRVATICALLSLASVTQAQQDLPDLTEGFTPPEMVAGPVMGGFPLADIGNVGLFSGKLGISLPLKAVTGRGSAGYTVSIPINQSWTIDSELTSGNTYENPVPSGWSTNRPGFGPGTVEGRHAADVAYSCSGYPLPSPRLKSTLSRITFIGNGEGEIELRDQATNGEPFQPADPCNPTAFNRGQTFISADGSGVTFVSSANIVDDDANTAFFPTGTLYLPNGNAYTVSSGKITQLRDRNGNYMAFEYNDPNAPTAPTKITDSIGREITFDYDSLSCGGLPCDFIHYDGNDGEDRTIRINYDDLSNLLDSGSVLQLNQLFPELNWNDTTVFDPRKVKEIQLPNGRKYKFTYNVYGEVVKVVLPTGARIEYTWSNGVSNPSHGGASADRSAVLRRVKEVRTYLDETTSTVDGKTKYTWETTSDCQPFDSMQGTAVKVDRYDGGSVVARTKHYFCGVAGSNPSTEVTDYAWWKRGLEYKAEQYTGTSTLVSTSVTTWEQRPANTGENIWWSGGVNDPNAPQMESRPKKVESTVNQGGPLTSKQEFLYDQYNNRTDVYEYDWGGSTPVRRTHLTYQTSSTYLDPTVHIRGLVTKTWTCGSGTGACTEGAAVAKTEFVYDGESLTAAGTNVTAQIYSPYTFTSYAYRGNLTKVRRWLNTPTAKWIESRVKYDTTGNPIQAIDPRSNSTLVSYGDSFESPQYSVTTKAFPTSISRGGLSVTKMYDYWLGRPTKFTDPNGVESTYDYDDNLDRLTDVIEANNHSTSKRLTELNYVAESGTRPYRIETVRDQYAYDDSALKSSAFYDRLGRQIATRSDACGAASQSYDGLSRVKYTANPVTNCSDWPPAPGAPWTQSQYDGLGRVTTLTRPGGAQTTTAYSGNKVTVTDPAGKKRDLFYDGLGRLTKVVEDPGGSLNYVTEYAYNELGKLTQALQKGTGGTGTQQTRSFTYDSLGRLLTADNPEDTGSISYAYDDNGNLLRKVDARGVAKCFYSNQTCSSGGALGTDGYDALNRAVVVTYSDSTPTERFCHDGKVYDTSTNACVTPGTSIPYSVGRLTSSGVAGVGASTSTSFDQLGRVVASEQKTYTGSAYETYVFAYSYNRDGSLASQTYPSGRVINFTYDGSGRPYSVQEPSSGPSYLNAVAYTAAGTIDNLQLGNSLVEQTCYNDLLQPVARRLGDATSTACAVQTSTDLLHLGFGYGTASANNGNMMQQTIWAPDNGSGSPWSVTQDYTYDAVNRLATSAEKLGGVQQWSRTLSYDHFGNRWVSGATGHTLHMATPTSSAAIQATTNRLTGTGITYDNAGNLTAHPYITPGSGAMAYDANNKMTAFTATGVSVATEYDAAGRRVRKIYNGKTTIWVYDAFGKLAAEYTTEAQTDEATYFRTTDHLGSTRLTTNEVGDVVARRDYFPFGERIDSTLSGRGWVADGGMASFNISPGMRQQFTAQQRDAETGLDYFWARYLAAPAGRFLSVDPENFGAKSDVPQSWNGYSYVLNSALRSIDSDGRLAYDILSLPTYNWVPGSLTGGDGTNELQFGHCMSMMQSVAGSGTSVFGYLDTASGCDQFMSPGSLLYDQALKLDAVDPASMQQMASALNSQRSLLETMDGKTPNIILDPAGAFFVGFGELFLNGNLSGIPLLLGSYVANFVPGAMISGALRAAPVFAAGGKTFLYTSRVLDRMDDAGAADLGHAFPRLLDELIVTYGTSTTKDGYTLFRITGSINNGKGGIYEIGGRWIDDVFHIDHRYFDSH